MSVNTIQEHRKLPRIGLQARVQIDLLRGTRLEANSINLSEEGMCVRLQESLEIRAAITLRLFSQSSVKPLECAGRVAWVVQRLDLRPTPPFLYDVGVEFIDPSPRLRLFASRAGVSIKPSIAPSNRSSLQPVTIHGREYVPTLDHEPSSTWHLVVKVDGMPCFSHRYPSQRAALKSWEQFKRQGNSPTPRAHDA